jgi:hypothetical protein
VDWQRARSIRLSRPFLIVVVALCALVSVMLATTGPWFRPGGRAQPTPLTTTPLPQGDDTAVALAGPIAAPAASATDRPKPVAEAGSRATRASAPTPLSVASARLCRSLSTSDSRDATGDWRCVPASRPVDSGPLTFYTRVQSPRDTTVQHRWYRGDRLYQAVDLRVRANHVNGYRTYSRYTMSSRSTGDWRVELRSRDGILLHEERFVVR